MGFDNINGCWDLFLLCIKRQLCFSRKKSFPELAPYQTACLTSQFRSSSLEDSFFSVLGSFLAISQSELTFNQCEKHSV